MQLWHRHQLGWHYLWGSDHQSHSNCNGEPSRPFNVSGDSWETCFTLTSLVPILFLWSFPSLFFMSTHSWNITCSFWFFKRTTHAWPWYVVNSLLKIQGNVCWVGELIIYNVAQMGRKENFCGTTITPSPLQNLSCLSVRLSLHD